ncbi:MAG: MarR family transcriptional regulator [Desulfuromonas sp.]|uniref:MarR family winged helix-turn-helix transcriptional regulator n=1 Tax=Desulfuromonas sp. TaxID=892 RepID=UPI000CBDF436|nr:MarR family transcriptional regulator [Desulfuromonas sp.]PLX86711.1 MAG: MarR family transcriptional regulator [Desulfuromonas sp.]
MSDPSEQKSEQSESGPEKGLSSDRSQKIKVLPGPGNTPQVPKGSYELRVLQSLRRIIRAVEIHSKKLAQNHKITGPQLGCLSAVHDSGPLTTTKLAQAVYLSPSTIVGIIDRLEEKGLVIRQRDSKDRRQVQICLTENGERLVKSTPSSLQDTLADALKCLPELEQVSITLALEKVVDLMEARKIEASPVLETGPLTSPFPPGSTPAAKS